MQFFLLALIRILVVTSLASSYYKSVKVCVFVGCRSNRLAGLLSSSIPKSCVCVGVCALEIVTIWVFNFWFY